MFYICPQIQGFDWKNCGGPDVPAVLKSLTMSPDPIAIPGALSASASGSTSVELSAPLSVSSVLARQELGPGPGPQMFPLPESDFHQREVERSLILKV